MIPGIPRRGACPRFVPLAVLAIVLFATNPARALAPPAIPISSDPGFLYGLSTPVLAPGGQGLISFHVGDPLGAPLRDVVLTFELYRFSPAPGGSTQDVPSGSMVLRTANSSGATVSIPLGSLAAGTATVGTVGVAAGGGAGEGGYAVRTTLSFEENGSGYRFSSRGYFSDATWNAATLPAGAAGAPQLNLTRLGVDGITPETAVGVHSDPWLGPIVVLAGAGILLAGVGGVYYFRYGPGSRSGATRADPPQSAPSAFGK